MRESVRFTRTQVKRAELEAHYALFRSTLKKDFAGSNFVPGDGNVNSEVVFVGEAPGVNEDKEKRPFVGASGQYLDKLLKTVDMKRGDIFITNFLKYRPPGNRDPKGDEVPVCSYLLKRELEILKPRIVVPLGRYSTSLFFEHPHMGTLAGQMWIKRGYTVVPMYHPAAALYDTSGEIDRRWHKDIKVVAEVFHGLTSTPLVKEPVKRKVTLTK